VDLYFKTVEISSQPQTNYIYIHQTSGPCLGAAAEQPSRPRQ